MITSKMLTWFSFDLARWASFWSKVTQFEVDLKVHQDKHFEHDSWWSLQKCDHLSVNMVFHWFDLVTYFFLPQMIQFQVCPRNHQDKHFEEDSGWLLQKNVTSRVFTRFSFDLAWWPSFKLDLEIIKATFWAWFMMTASKNVTFRVLTRFSFDFAWWPSFLT